MLYLKLIWFQSGFDVLAKIQLSIRDYYPNEINLYYQDKHQRTFKNIIRILKYFKNEQLLFECQLLSIVKS